MTEESPLRLKTPAVKGEAQGPESTRQHAAGSGICSTGACGPRPLAAQPVVRYAPASLPCCLLRLGGKERGRACDLSFSGERRRALECELASGRQRAQQGTPAGLASRTEELCPPQAGPGGALTRAQKRAQTHPGEHVPRRACVLIARLAARARAARLTRLH